MSNYKSKHTGAQVDEAVSKVLNGEVGGGVTPNDSLFEKGDAENSAVLKGGNNKATNDNEVALGKYNISSSDTQFSIGIGTSDTDRKNAFEVKQNGDIYIEGVEGRIQDKLNTSTSVTPDWNAKEGESGYIENKPFYISYSNKITEYQQNQLLNYKSKKIIFNDRLITLSIGENIIDSHLKLILSVDDDNDYWLMAEYYGEPYSVLTVYAGVYIKKLNEYYLPDIVLKTTPQTLTTSDKNQALANLGIDPVVWKYLCNPFILQTGRQLPDELLTEDRQDFKYKIDGMYRWAIGFTVGTKHRFCYQDYGVNELNKTTGILINMAGCGNELIDGDISNTDYDLGDTEWDDYFTTGGWHIRDGKCYIAV